MSLFNVFPLSYKNHRVCHKSLRYADTRLEFDDESTKFILNSRRYCR